MQLGDEMIVSPARPDRQRAALSTAAHCCPPVPTAPPRRWHRPPRVWCSQRQSDTARTSPPRGAATTADACGSSSNSARSAAAQLLPPDPSASSSTCTVGACSSSSTSRRTLRVDPPRNRLRRHGRDRRPRERPGVRIALDGRRGQRAGVPGRRPRPDRHLRDTGLLPRAGRPGGRSGHQPGVRGTQLPLGRSGRPAGRGRERPRSRRRDGGGVHRRPRRSRDATDRRRGRRPRRPGLRRLPGGRRRPVRPSRDRPHHLHPGARRPDPRTGPRGREPAGHRAGVRRRRERAVRDRWDGRRAAGQGRARPAAVRGGSRHVRWLAGVAGRDRVALVDLPAGWEPLPSPG